MIYQLFLPSQYGRQVNGVTSNIMYDVNWDELFQKENYNYKKCRVRFQFQSTTLQDQTAVAAGEWEYYARTGYLTANFSAVNQATARGKSVNGGCVLGIIKPTNIQAYIKNDQLTNSFTWISYENSTLNTKGVEIATPVGTGALNLQLYCWYSATATAPTLMTYDQDYEIILEFEFSDDD